MAKDVADNIARLRQLAVATLSDGCDQIAGQRGYMDFDIKGRVNVRKIVGCAATVLEVPSSEKFKPELAFDMIDAATPGAIICIASGANANVAVWGELMNAGAVVRGLEFRRALADVAAAAKGAAEQPRAALETARAWPPPETTRRKRAH